MTTTPDVCEAIREQSPSRGSHATVLIYAPDAGDRAALTSDVSSLGFAVHAAGRFEDAQRALSHGSFEVCIIDESAAIGRGDLGSSMQPRSITDSSHLPAELVHLVPREQLETDAAATDGGQLLEKPYTSVRLAAVLSAAVERHGLMDENRRLKRLLFGRHLNEIIGHSPAASRLRDDIKRAAEDDCPVFVTGSPGTETGLVAQVIHVCSSRATRPIVRLDCSRLSADALERTLFGPSRNHISHSSGESEPLLVGDHGGTLLLDNIDQMPVWLQERLLRVVERQQFLKSPHSSHGTWGVRAIAATHLSLSDLRQNERFHSELLQHLSQRVINIPTLKERVGDMIAISERLLDRLALEQGTPPRNLSFSARELLESYDWPGNTRELQAVLEQACALDAGEILTAEMLRPWLQQGAHVSQTYIGPTLDEMERGLIEATFTRCGGNREQTAKTLKIGLRTLSGKLRQYGYPPRGGPGSNRPNSRLKAA